METNTRTQRIVVVAYAALYIAAFVDLLADQHDTFWQEPAGVIVALMFGGLLIALVVRRQRWAWIILVAFETAGIIALGIESSTIGWIVWNVARFLLLISPQMWRYTDKNATKGRELVS